MRVVNLKHRNASDTNLANYTYTYDVADRLTSETRNGTLRDYSYNATDELLGDGVGTFDYDLAGNRNTTGYVTGPKNQYLSDGVFNYFYDNEGNLDHKVRVSDGQRTTFTYDHRNQLTDVERAPAAGPIDLAVEFKYDVFGNRIEEIADLDGAGGGSAVTTRFAYDGLHVWADLDGSSSLTTRRIFGDQVDQVLARLSGSTVSWYLTDRLGSVREVANNTTGAFIDEVSYGGFGNVESETTPANGDRYKFTGREFFAEIGLYDYRARTYDATIGRFQQEDPIFMMDVNPYRYVRNRPTNYTDPSGQYLVATNQQQADSWAQWFKDKHGINASPVQLSTGKYYLHFDSAERNKLEKLRDKMPVTVSSAMNLYTNAWISEGGVSRTPDTRKRLGIPQDKNLEKLTLAEMGEILGREGKKPAETIEDVRDRMLSLVVLRGEGIGYNENVLQSIRQIRNMPANELAQYLLIDGKLERRDRVLEQLKNRLRITGLNLDRLMSGVWDPRYPFGGADRQWWAGLYWSEMVGMQNAIDYLSNPNAGLVGDFTIINNQLAPLILGESAHIAAAIDWHNTLTGAGMMLLSGVILGAGIAASIPSLGVGGALVASGVGMFAGGTGSYIRERAHSLDTGEPIDYGNVYWSTILGGGSAPLGAGYPIVGVGMGAVGSGTGLYSAKEELKQGNLRTATVDTVFAGLSSLGGIYSGVQLRPSPAAGLIHGPGFVMQPGGTTSFKFNGQTFSSEAQVRQYVQLLRQLRGNRTPQLSYEPTFTGPAPVENPLAARTLRPNQVNLSAIGENTVVRSPADVRNVIGDALQATGTSQNEISGLYSYLRQGRGAGFQGVTGNAASRPNVVLANFETSQGEVIAAIDVSKIPAGRVYNLADPAVRQQFLQQYPRFQGMYERIASEGVIAVRGDIPAEAVTGVARISKTADAATKQALISELLK
jgi:RHS repeat-associated protein